VVITPRLDGLPPNYVDDRTSLNASNPNARRFFLARIDVRGNLPQSLLRNTYKEVPPASSKPTSMSHIPSSWDKTLVRPPTATRLGQVLVQRPTWAHVSFDTSRPQSE
jgi:hypothetical protein